ncbi:XdhC/CoxF family protein [Ochrobactrum cytisi]|nr:XdhC/CoxF family protein [Brucella cytisi]
MHVKSGERLGRGEICGRLHACSADSAFGQGIEPDAFSELAHAAGIAVERPESVDRIHIDSYTAVVLLQHDLEKDMPVLQAALATDAFYIGCLGSLKTHRKRGERLIELGFVPSQIGRIRAPIGMWGQHVMHEARLFPFWRKLLPGITRSLLIILRR